MCKQMPSWYPDKQLKSSEEREGVIIAALSQYKTDFLETSIVFQDSCTSVVGFLGNRRSAALDRRFRVRLAWQKRRFPLSQNPTCALWCWATPTGHKNQPHPPDSQDWAQTSAFYTLWLKCLWYQTKHVQTVSKSGISVARMKDCCYI